MAKFLLLKKIDGHLVRNKRQNNSECGTSLLCILVLLICSVTFLYSNPNVVSRELIDVHVILSHKLISQHQFNLLV